MNQYRCENCTKEDCWYFKMRDDSRTIKDKYGELLTPRSFTWEKGCASHSDFQSERDTHWRDLFVSDLRSLIKWDAEHGNPELFKAVVTLNKHYNTFSVEQHDKQVREKVLDELKSWCVQMKCNGCPYGGVLFGKITELRQAGEQEANRD